MQIFSFVLFLTNVQSNQMQGKKNNRYFLKNHTEIINAIAVFKKNRSIIVKQMMKNDLFVC